MGEFFELQEMGILDEMGEYIGYGSYSFQNHETHKRNQRVRGYMCTRGLKTPKAQRKALKEFGLSVSQERPTYYANLSKENMKAFKAFIDVRVGYVKPSKKLENETTKSNHLQQRNPDMGGE